jgi:uncharacterized protein (DUF2164 family)
MKILLIEDDRRKSEDISNLIHLNIENVILDIKESYQSGIRSLLSEEYELLLLDMSIPTWDMSKDGRGGSFEKFGGYKILKESKRKGIIVKTILVSMFEDFSSNDSNLTLKDIDQNLKQEFFPSYLGYVYYNSKEQNWKDSLLKLVDKLKEEE